MGITSSLTDITTAAQSYIVAPIAAFGLAGFVFNAQGEAISDVNCDITDHYAEDNKAIQDMIAVKPEKITLKGYVGELVYSPSGSNTILQSVPQKLVTAAAFLPALTAGATTIANGISNPSTLSLSSISDIYGLVKNVLGAFGNMANQQNAYTYFKSLAQTKTVCGIQTPWAFLANMVIESVRAIQDDKTPYMSDFAVTYKQIRTATVTTTAFSAGGVGGIAPAGGAFLQGDSAIQAETQATLGNLGGAPLPTPIPGAQSGITGASSLFNNAAIKSIFMPAGS
jgi:hypothetical protein